MRIALLPVALAISATMARPSLADGEPAWAESTRSPRYSPTPDARDSELLAGCGRGDAALHEVASRLALRELTATDPESLTHALRLAGDPHVRPRAWTLSGAGIRSEAALARLRKWLSSFEARGERRCGVASSRDDNGKDVIAVVVVDAQADLAPVPVRARAGEWIAIDARLNIEAANAKVVVLGPFGSPQPVLTSHSEGRVRARFRADRSGRWLAQVLVMDEEGPRPVLEATIFASMTPDISPTLVRAPGEDEDAAGLDPADALTKMMASLRASEGLAPLVRDPRLDRLAREHAERMRVNRRIAHDLGDGTPHERIEQAGIAAKAKGENVAHATTVAEAHRALWASPSHRANLLHPKFNRLGIGVVRDADGSLWVTQLFAER